MKDKALSLVLDVIGERVGLTASQVKEQAEAGTLSDRYQACSTCRVRSCSRCQIAFSQQTKITH